LYDLNEDRQERNDLAAAHPERVKELVAEYNAWAERCFVLPKSNPKSDKSGEKKKVK